MKYNPATHLVSWSWISYEWMTPGAIVAAWRILSNTSGRHAAITYPLETHLSDFSLQRERVRVMLMHLISLAELDIPIIILSDDEKTKLLLIAEKFSDQDYIAIFEYDHTWRDGTWALEHDVKAVEYFIWKRLYAIWLERLIPSVHMLCTSEDVNNIAYQVNLRNATNDVILPRLRWVIQPLVDLAETHASDTILGRTHGQVAVPTTFGKLIAVELNTLSIALEPLTQLIFSGKFSGATGSNADHKLTLPDVDWIAYEKKFVGKFGLRQNLASDQRWQLIERVQLFQILQNINNVLINLWWKLHDLCARGILVQKQVAWEVGSSVMPGKTNPWRIEEMEWVLKLANSGFQASIDNHLITHRERDLAEHPLERNYGEPFGQMLVGMVNFIEQLSRFEFSSKNANEELDKNPEVIGSGIQNVLRSKWIVSAYTFLAKLMKWRNVTLADIHSFIKLLWASIEQKSEMLPTSTEAVREMEASLSLEEKSEFHAITLDTETLGTLMKLDPKTYIGDSPKRTELASRQLIATMGAIDTRVMLALNRPRLLAVGWDFDDTLYLGDKEELRARLGYISEELSLSLTEDQLESICKLARWDEQKALIITSATANLQTVTDEQIERKQEEAKPKFEHLLRMDEWAIDTLELLKRKWVAQFLITNRWPKTLSSAVERFKLKQYFAKITDASNLFRKPDPRLMQEVLWSLNVHPSKDWVLYIGDHSHIDVWFAQSAGVTPIHVNRTGSENIHGIVRVRNMSECFRYLSMQLL